MTNYASSSLDRAGVEPLGRRRIVSPAIVESFARMTECCVITATGLAAYAIWGVPRAGPSILPLLIIALMSAIWLLITQGLNAYALSALRSPLRSGVPLLVAWVSGFAALYGSAFVFRGGPAPWLADWALLGTTLLIVERIALYGLVAALGRSGRLCRRAVIVGGGAAAETLIRALSERADKEVQILGLFDDRAEDRSPALVSGCLKIGTVDELVAFARLTPVDLVLFALPITAEERLLGMLRKLWVLPVDIRLAAHMSELRFRARAYSYIGTVPVLALFDKPVADWDMIVKTVFDKIIGTLCLLVFAPVMLLVALAVKLDSPGPVLFCQKRYGFNNEPIDVFKFRSMYVDQLDYDVVEAVTPGDRRVTRVGRFIRKTSLDELPQLFNVVFKGNLSLVGPRPHALNGRTGQRLYDEVVDGYCARHRVVPGMTGWAQVNGWRGATDTPEKIQKRVECDLYYIENWSIAFDLYILAATSVAMCRMTNAA